MKAKNGDVGSAFLPIVVGGMLVVLSLIYLGSTLLEIKQRKNRGEEAEEEQIEEILKPDNRKIALTFVLLAAYVLLLKPVGFVITSIVYLFLQMNVMSDEPTVKQRVVFAVLSVIVPVIVYYVFVNLFSMVLPAGILG